MQNNTPSNIEASLVRKLLSDQFPEWQNLPISQILPGGWDNRVFKLGNNMLVRLLSADKYAIQVEKEQYWLPKLSPLLPVSIPSPIAVGKPTKTYPWPWSVYHWIVGETAEFAQIINLPELANDLGIFLNALHHIDTAGGPPAGNHNFYRGGPLSTYNTQTHQAIALLKDKINTNIATEIWESALKTTWNRAPVWVHGDIGARNLLMKHRKLHAVIDFGGIAIGDPACDLAIAWTFFNVESRHVFKQVLKLNEDTWTRGKAWALWKALIIAAKLIDGPSVEKSQAWPTLEAILETQR